MTDKEIDIQTALGTLPLWKRIELGMIDFIEMPSLIHKDVILITCKELLPLHRHYYLEGHRAEVVQRIILDCKNNNYD
ncbi:hypothetical protein LCGC14_1461480 [marine sediment metagenome]|uniref:Uncharacterized protein n=1 Tax=marine sediment metagenome TaxID=412755 RepID=A0A0F9MH12_9ZZZZ